MRNTEKVRRSAAPNLLVQFPLAELTLQLAIDPSKSRRSILARADGRSQQKPTVDPSKSRRQEPTVDPDMEQQPPSPSPFSNPAPPMPASPQCCTTWRRRSLPVPRHHPAWQRFRPQGSCWPAVAAAQSPFLSPVEDRATKPIRPASQ
jgi:hypothetical protein